MIQFNLLPDVKQQYIKAQAVKRLVITVCFIVSAAVLFLFLVILSSVYVIQRKNIHDLEQDIHTNTATLQNLPDVADILTVQGQLNSLVTLNAQKPAASRIFGFLSGLTPNTATISDLKIDYAQHTMTISGNAPSLDVVNTFVDGMKFTTYTLNGQSGSSPAFSQVVLTGFSRNAKSATYSITSTFDPAIFNNANNASLSVGPQTQSSVQQPSIIFRKNG